MSPPRKKIAVAIGVPSNSGSFTTTVDGSDVYNASGYTGDFKGSGLPYTPEFSGNIDAQYEWNWGDRLKPFIGGTLVYLGGQNATFQNSVLVANEFKIPGYTTVDLRAGLGAQDGLWKLTLFGRNVFDKDYTTSITTFRGRHAIGSSARKSASEPAGTK